jgi:predicted O-methyltransferase YrrM
MNPVLAEILRTNIVKSESGKELRLHSQIPVQEGLFLQEMVARTKPGVSLEIGLGFGISAHFICEALSQLPHSRHIAIDRHQFDASATHISFEGSGLYNLRLAGYNRLIEFHPEPSYIALPSLVSQGTKVDLAFIDGWHTFDYALTDFFYVDLLLRPGGVVVIDDTNFPSVWRLCRFIVTNLAYTVAGRVPLQSESTPSPLFLVTKSLWAVGDKIGSIIRGDSLYRHSRCIAFRKEADDTRSWDFHHRF